MKSSLRSNILGYASLVCSLSFWILLGISYVHNIQKFDLSFSYWASVWAIGFMLAIIAGILGSKRWFWAAILPFITLVGMLALINIREPPH